MSFETADTGIVRRPQIFERSRPWLGDFGEVAVFGHLAVLGGLFCLERFLMRIPAVLSGSATGCGHMSATTMPASPPASATAAGLEPWTRYDRNEVFLPMALSRHTAPASSVTDGVEF
jgi:hypothetical protein